MPDNTTRPPADGAGFGPIDSVSRILPWIDSDELALDRLNFAIDHLATVHDLLSDLDDDEDTPFSDLSHALDVLLLAGTQVLALRRHADDLLLPADVWAGIGIRRAQRHETPPAGTVNPDPAESDTLEEAVAHIVRSMNFMQEGYDTYWHMTAEDTPESGSDALLAALDEIITAIRLFVTVTRKFEASMDIEDLWTCVGMILEYIDEQDANNSD